MRRDPIGHAFQHLGEDDVFEAVDDDERQVLMCFAREWLLLANQRGRDLVTAHQQVLRAIRVMAIDDKGPLAPEEK